MRMLFFFRLCGLTMLASGQQNAPSSFSIYSSNVKDSFGITITKPAKLDSSKKYNVIVYLDGGINSGKEMTKLAKNSDNKKLKANTIFVGITHKGDYHKLRPRDFIPPKWVDGKEVQGKEKNYGHADRFYRFLEKELLPMVAKQYYGTGSKTIVGHSFGGLFVYYCLMRTDRIFNNYFALSPSLWVDYSNFFEREESFYANNKSLPAYLYMTCGTLEFANYVLPTNRRMNTVLKDRSYKKLRYEYIEKNWANHNSHVPLTLKEVLNKLEAL